MFTKHNYLVSRKILCKAFYFYKFMILLQVTTFELKTVYIIKKMF